MDEKILLIDVDSKMPNLPLMKISNWHKKRGDKIELRKLRLNSLGLPHPVPTKVYVSCIFTKNRELAINIQKMFSCEVQIGGYGVNDVKLPEEIEHEMPDYELYGMNYSLGFTSRGCIRNCPWCIVPQKEGRIRDHAPLSEFLSVKHSKLILWDNNFLASPEWFSNLNKIKESKLLISFNQGLDIRLVDNEIAKMLAKLRYSDCSFKGRRLYFSFDTLTIKDEVLTGIQKLLRAGIKPHHLMFYTLHGFGIKAEDYSLDYFYEYDKSRFDLLQGMGIYVFPMLYNNREDIPLLRYFRKWAIRRYYRVCKFEDYKPFRNWLKTQKAYQ